MRRSGFGFVALAGALAWSGALATGCGSSTSSSQSPGTPSGSGGSAASSGGATAPAGNNSSTGGGTGGASAAPPVSAPGGPLGQTGGAPPATGGTPTSTGGTGPSASSGGAGGKSGAPGGTTSAGTGGAAPPAGGATGTDPGTDGDGDFTIMPPYAGTVQVTNVPHSTKFQFQFDNSTSKVYPATGTRPITIYIPKQYVDGTAAPFIIITDGNAPATGSPEIVTAAENHYEDTDPTTKIPPIVFVFVPPGAQRSVEYDTVSDAFSRFIDGEILPLVGSNADIKAAFPNFKLTTYPEGRAAYGCSSGSPAAMGLGWFADFHRIVSYSGTFVALQMTTDHPLGAWEYPAMFLATTPPKPLRIFLEVGEMDNGYMTDASMHRNWVVGNQNLAAALKTMGYHYRFLYAMGAGHCDGSVKSKTYAQTLNWVWRGYVPN